jgi:serine-aspartate repeat-containing protein C/D/E
MKLRVDSKLMVTALVLGWFLSSSFSNAASIGDFVWYDENRNGIQEDDEAGVQDVFVELVDSSGTPIAQTTTGPDGSYSFVDFVSGNYDLVFVAPTDYAFTAQDQGANDSVDSDADSSGSASIFVSGDGYDDTLDAGLVTVPIPAAAWLFGTGLIALAGLKRRQRS